MNRQPLVRTVGPIVAVTAVAALVAFAAVEDRVFVETEAWWAVVWAGAAVAGAATAVVVVRQRLAEAGAKEVAAVREAAASDHRRFLLRLDHELKNPITAIQAGLANLAAPEGTPGLATVSAQARRLAELVGELRKLAELETRPIERDPVDLGELLGEVFEAASELPAAGDRLMGINLPQAPWPLGTIPGDRDLLFLAIYNLLVNAVKFTQSGDRIELRARDEGDHVLVEVADTGIGIPADELDQIWDELARGSAAAGTPGSGLGLALARVVVGRHEGSVVARSRVGDGTVVAFRLPAM